MCQQLWNVRFGGLIASFLLCAFWFKMGRGEAGDLQAPVRAGGEEGNTANIPVLVLGSSISNGLSRQRGNSCKGCAHNPINLPAPEGSPAIRAASEAWVENSTEEGEGRGDVFRTVYELCWKRSSTCSFIWQGSVLSLQLHRVVLLHIVWDLINFCRIFSSCALITLI